MNLKLLILETEFLKEFIQS